MLKKKIYKAVSIFVIISFMFCPRYGFALPTGEQVVAGQAEFQRSGNTMNVNVSTDKMIANYNSFSIAQSEAVHFNQPSASSVALNRVIGADASSIFGTLTANGRIFLINPNGILFGPGSQVNAGGLLASTLNISDADFLAGRLTFYGKGGEVINQGYIKTPGGYTTLLGSHVGNSGIIEANLGSVALASGEKITLNLDSKGIISVVIDEATTQNLGQKDDAINNSGRITADGGKVILTAKALDGVFKRAVNTSGLIEANALDAINGEITLSTNQRVNLDGRISANGGKVKVDSQGADFYGTIDAAEGIYNMHDGDTNILGGTYSGSHSWTDHLNIFVLGDVIITDNGNILIAADSDSNHSGNLWTFAGLTTHGGNITLKGENIDLNGLIQSFGGNVNVSAPGTITHHALGDVNTGGGDFVGNAGLDYILRNDASITTGGGLLDISAGNSVVWGTPGTDYVSTFFWKYLSGDRWFKLTELGYYYYDTTLAKYVYVPFAQGTDIGQDGGLTSGAGLTYSNIGGSFKLYAKFNPRSGSGDFLWHEEDALNADLLQHAKIVSGVLYDWNYNWNDNLPTGDWDFNDAVIGFSPRYAVYYPTIDPRLFAIDDQKYFKAYYEILRDHRVVYTLPINPTTFYFYHPLTPMDYSAFDNIKLDIGAYDFIDGNLNFKDPGSLSNYYGSIGPKGGL